MRSLLAEVFTPAFVRALCPRIHEVTRGLVDRLAHRPVVEVVEEFAAPVPILVICELLGVSIEYHFWFRQRAVALKQGSSARQGNYSVAETAANEFTDYFLRAVRRPREHGLIALLVRTGFPEDEIVGTCVSLITAGHETTTYLISKAMLALWGHPEEFRSCPVLTSSAVDELIRYDTPVQMVSRWAYRDVVVGGREIHHGDKVVLVVGSVNRDPSRLTAPDTLLLDRTPGRHCGFGLGIHRCLGSALARIEAEIGLTTLIRNLPSPSLTDEPVHYAEDLVFQGPTQLILRTGRHA